jgi:hypothetical protein
MSTDTNPTIRTRKTLTAYYIGRPASLYIEALARRPRPALDPTASPGRTAEQPAAR